MKDAEETLRLVGLWRDVFTEDVRASLLAVDRGGLGAYEALYRLSSMLGQSVKQLDEILEEP